MNNSANRFLAAIGISAGLLLSVCIIAILASLSDGIAIPSDAKIIGLISALCLAFTWKQIRSSLPTISLAGKSTDFVLGFTNLVYGLICALLGISGAVTIWAIFQEVSDGLDSFLTSPLGIKPDHVNSGIGSVWEWLVGITIVFWLLYRAAKGGRMQLKAFIATRNTPL